MAETINVHEAKTHFSKLLARVAAGEEIIISKAGKPVARLSPMSPMSPAIVNGKRVLGIDVGKFKVPDDFNHPMSEEELAEWYRVDELLMPSPKNKP